MQAGLGEIMDKMGKIKIGVDQIKANQSAGAM
jgi:hypothetical protein